VAAGDLPLEPGRAALGDQFPAIEHGDTVGELVGFLEVLGGEEDVTPSATRSRMICHTVRRLRGSSPVVNLSRKMILGLPTSVIARSSRRS